MRQHAAQMAMRLRASEDACRALEQHATDLQARLLALNDALEAERKQHAQVSDAAQRRAELDQALERLSSDSSVHIDLTDIQPGEWADTEPLQDGAGHFAETRPAEWSDMHQA